MLHRLMPLLLIATLAACGKPSEAEAPNTAAAPQSLDTGDLREDELAPAPPDAEAPDVLPPVAADHPSAAKARWRIVNERGYSNARGEFVADVLERDEVYFAAVLETPDGNPVQGVTPEIRLNGSSTRIPVPLADAGEATDATGTIEFGLRGGRMGEDRITVRHGKAQATIVLNVISLQAAGYAPLMEVKGALRWDDLMRAQLRYAEDHVAATFTPDISARNGKTVKLVGFVMPLDAAERQTHFLLTSNPPSCFFHIPGGAAGAVEVFATKGIKADSEPVVLEGRFQALTRSELGVVYRLRDARLVKR